MSRPIKKAAAGVKVRLAIISKDPLPDLWFYEPEFPLDRINRFELLNTYINDNFKFWFVLNRGMRISNLIFRIFFFLFP